MRKLIITGMAVAMLAVPTASMAAAPDGQFHFKATSANSENASIIGELSSQITQNGQFVSGHGPSSYDQTTTPGSRADAVQALLVHGLDK